MGSRNIRSDCLCLWWDSGARAGMQPVGKGVGWTMLPVIACGIMGAGVRDAIVG